MELDRSQRESTTEELKLRGEKKWHKSEGWRRIWGDFGYFLHNFNSFKPLLGPKQMDMQAGRQTQFDHQAMLLYASQ